MKRYLLPSVSVAVAAFALNSACTAPEGTATTTQEPGTAVDPIARGELLVTTMGCGHCHSPHDQTGQAIPGLELSGHPAGAPLPTWRPEMLEEGILATISPTFTAFAGPFGLSVAGNLTPDEETGIGQLTADMLIESWRSGNHWKFDNRPVLQPMPTLDFGALPDEDIRAIHAYLMSLEPVRNEVPLSQPAEMGN